MRWVFIILLFLVVIFISFAIYVRLAPTDAALYSAESPPLDPGDYAGANSFTAVRAITTPADGILTALQRIAEQTPRTELIAGSVAEQRMTFQTLSALMAYPDYTTISIIAEGAAPGGNTGPLLMIAARSRYGQSDLGVNRARVESWLTQLGPLVVAP